MRLGLMRLKYDQAGGAEKSLGLLARGLADRGHQVKVVAGSWQGQPPPGVEVEALDLGAKGWRQVKELARLGPPAMAAWEPDAWLSLERIPGAPLIRAGDGSHAAWLERRAAHDLKPRVWLRRIQAKHAAFLALERAAFTHPDLRGVIANSRLVAGELAQRYGLGDDKLTVIYNGVDHSQFSPQGSEQARVPARETLGLYKGQPVLLFLGSGWERKGLAFALAALARLKDARLLVAGKDRIAPWQAKAKRLGVEARVRFLGPRNDAPALLAACDAMVLPTVYDPCANACLEALCAGRPVVTTPANGAAELVRPGVGGAVVDDPSDAKALAQACQGALALERPFAHEVPSLDQWLDRMAGVMERVGQGGGL